MDPNSRFSSTPRAIHWADRLSGRAGWMALIAGSALCAVALLLS